MIAIHSNWPALHHVVRAFNLGDVMAEVEWRKDNWRYTTVVATPNARLVEAAMVCFDLEFNGKNGKRRTVTLESDFDNSKLREAIAAAIADGADPSDFEGLADFDERNVTGPRKIRK